MVDTLRRLIAGAMILTAVVGLMPLLSLAFGFTSASVSTASGNRRPWADEANGQAILSCRQEPGSLALTRNQNSNKTIYASAGVLRCTNYLPFPVTVTWSIPAGQDGNTGVTMSGSDVIAASAVDQCAEVKIMTGSNNPERAITIRGTVAQANLEATFDFFGSARVVANGNSYSSCP